MDFRALQETIFIRRYSHLRRFLILPHDFVVLDRSFGGLAVVFDCGGMREMPFDKRGPHDERDIVEVDDLAWQ